MDDDNKPDKKHDNIIGLDQKRKEQIKKKKQEEKAYKQERQNPSYYMPHSQSGLSSDQHTPIFNIPTGTKYLLFLIIIIHLIVFYLLNENLRYWVFYHLGFVPIRFTDGSMFEPLQILTPITHMFLHGSWLHIGMNAVMLLAFGSGLEKWVGAKKMFQIFFICGLFGVATHFIFNLNSLDPVIGASGGLSGMFAAVLVMLHRQNLSQSNKTVGGKFGMMPIIALWVGISVLFGVMGSPDGSSIAWLAHIGGFLGGFAAIRFLKI